MSRLSFNMEDFIWAQSEYLSALSDLQSIKKQLIQDVETLKNQDWKSKGGEAFLNNFNSEWVEQVTLYEDTIQVLVEMLKEVETSFKSVQDEAEQLHY